MLSLSKKWKAWLIATAALALMIATIPLAIWVTHTTSAQLENAKSRCDSGMYSSHTVIIKDEAPIPAHTNAKLCDTLTISNQDGKDLLIAFGPHEHHVSYDGVSERLLSSGQSLTITLIEPGNFHFHDHIADVIQGTFSVAK